MLTSLPRQMKKHYGLKVAFDQIDIRGHEKDHNQKKIKKKESSDLPDFLRKSLNFMSVDLNIFKHVLKIYGLENDL